jgi:hypothetical protein
MKSNKSWTTIVEAMIAMFIVIVWTIWVYIIYERSQKLSISVENRVKAISIAREWIEVLQNIRDTNWVLFWADSKNCWNVKDYDVSCLWDSSLTYKISSWSYTIYKDTDNRWKLNPITGTGEYNDTDWLFRNKYRIKLDGNWLYTQSWGTTFNPIFTRKINISYIDTNWSWLWDEYDEKMLVKSIVSWSDSSKVWYYTVTLDNLLTNWKKD